MNRPLPIADLLHGRSHAGKDSRTSWAQPSALAASLALDKRRVFAECYGLASGAEWLRSRLTASRLLCFIVLLGVRSAAQTFQRHGTVVMGIGKARP